MSNKRKAEIIKLLTSTIESEKNKSGGGNNEYKSREFGPAIELLGLDLDVRTSNVTILDIPPAVNREAISSISSL